jgi:hypothetical protein
MQITDKQYSEKIMEGFRLAVKKVVDEAREKKDYIVVSDKDGNVRHVYPHLEENKKKTN